MNRHWSVPLLLAGVLLHIGCASTPLAFRAGPSGDFVHIHSGMSFPSAVGGFNRVSTLMFDGAGYDVGVGYLLPKPVRIVMTIYVYPSEDKRLEEAFDKATNEVQRAHPDAEPISSGDEITHRQGSNTTVGKSSVYAFTEKGRELISTVLLFEYGPWLFLYRVTCERKNQAEAAGEVEEFMNALSWPAL
jgi:hypothetical protein